MIIPIFEITFAFLILFSVLGLIITRCRISPILKALIIVVSLWYAMILFFVPEQFSGHSRPVSELEDGCWIINYRVVEPSSTDTGHIYFWVLTNPLKNRNVTEGAPMSVWIPYNKALHKMLEKLRKRIGKRGIMVYRQGRDRSGSGQSRRYGKGRRGGKKGGRSYGVNVPNSRGKFEIINPTTLLPAKEK